MSGNNVLDMQQSPTSAYLPLSAINNNDQIPPQHQLQSPAISLARNAGLQKCFNKVWVEVDRAVAKLRQVLFKELGQHYRQSAATSSDQQEKLVSYLIELDSPEDPVWFLVCSQYKALLHSLRASYEEMLTQVESTYKFI
jgi:hypothetical protein